jgi:hypothetical protein
MRLALQATGEVGTRAGRVLLAERSLTALGLVDQNPTERDSRLERAEVLATYDALVTDAAEPEDDIAMALTAGISCIVWADADAAVATHADQFEAAGLRLLTGCNLASGIAPSLIAHEVAATENVLETTIAWTEPGSPRRRGQAIPFPDPVGSRWGEERPTPFADRCFVARTGGEWAAAMARVTGASEAGVLTRIVGVSDLAVHLEALAVAAGAMMVNEYPPGASRPGDLSERYLARLLDAGLDVAAHTLHGN